MHNVCSLLVLGLPSTVHNRYVVMHAYKEYKIDVQPTYA